MIIASASALKKLVKLARGSGGSFVSANANTSVKISKGRIASVDAAAMGLVGTIARIKSPNGGTAATDGAVVSADFRASAEAAGMGNNARNVGIKIAPMIADSDISVTIHVSDRPASRPARAACAVWAIPVINKATTSGTIVIRKPLSHSAPIGSATSAMPPARTGSTLATPIPMMRPKTSARSIRVAFDMGR